MQPDNFPYKEEIAALSNVCLVLIVLLFISSILGFKVMFSHLNLHIFFIRLAALIVLSKPTRLIFAAQQIVLQLI